MSEDSYEPFLKERRNIKSENVEKDFLDGSVKTQQPDIERNAALSDVVVETDDKFFIYDVHENPPVLMTVFFAMQVSCHFFLVKLQTSEGHKWRIYSWFRLGAITRTIKSRLGSKHPA